MRSFGWMIKACLMSLVDVAVVTLVLAFLFSFAMKLTSGLALVAFLVGVPLVVWSSVLVSWRFQTLLGMWGYKSFAVVERHGPRWVTLPVSGFRNMLEYLWRQDFDLRQLAYQEVPCLDRVNLAKYHAARGLLPRSRSVAVSVKYTTRKGIRRRG